MTGWHLGAMVTLDFESTGLDVENDRIVTACIGLVDGTGQRETEVIEAVIDPGIPIPEQAARIHGWTTERVKAFEGAMAPADGIEFITEMLARALLDQPEAPLIGHNLGGYDLTLHDRECRRHGVRLLGDRLGDRPLYVVDTMVLSRHLDPNRPRPSKQQGPHVLKTCAEAFGVPWDDAQAHGSTFDALTSARIAWKIAALHPQLACLPLALLHERQVEWKRSQDVALAAKLRSYGHPVDGLDGTFPMRPFERQEVLS
jgi:DNA polymerase III subunit epsilon